MPSKKHYEVDRRKFLEISVNGAIGASLFSLPIVSMTGCTAPKTKTFYGACYHDCPDRCSWTVTTEDDKVKTFQASQDNPYTAGKLCSKMENFPNDVTFHPDRILKPLKRTGKKGEGSFEEVSWEEALADIASKLKTIIQENGGESVLPFSYGGNQGMVQGGTIASRFFAHIGASRLEATICGDAVVAGVMATNGQTTGVLPEDIIHSKFIILWGTNPVNTNQHLWTIIEKAQRDGAKVVVIDPFESQTAQRADWHVSIMPGTDTALAFGMMNVILSEQLHDQDYIDQYTSGIEALSEHIKEYTPEVVAEITGLDKETIIELARAYAAASPSLIRVLIGIEHQSNGGSASRAIAMLPAMTGAWRHLGGGLMNMTYEPFGEALNYESISLPEALSGHNTRYINMVQLGKYLSDPELEPAINAFFVFNANPAVTMPNQNLVMKGLEREDLLTIVLEHFMTDTARYADYVFPATTVLENWDILDSWGTTYLNINQPVIPPLGESKSNTDFFRELSKVMGFQDDYFDESDLEIVKKVLDTNHPYMKGITFSTLQKTGWAKLKLPENWMPHEKGNFATPSGKCMFYNEDIDPPLPEFNQVVYTDDYKIQFPFHLLAIKTPSNFLNSSHANVDYLIEREGKPFLDLNEADAALKNISDGDEVRVFNERGEIYLTARIKNKVRKGVVCVPQGFWPSLMKGGRSANALTDHRLTDMGRGAAIQEAKVNFERV